MQKSCERCLWGLSCESKTPCEDFYPLFKEEEELLAAEEYEADLRERHLLYKQQIAEDE